MREFSSEELTSLALELPDEIQKYKDRGDFAAAQQSITRWLQMPVAEELKTRLRYEQYILEELPKEFPYNKDQTLQLFREKVPGYTEEDLQREEEANLAEWIYLDGEKRYIHNLVRNIMDKDVDLQERAGIRPYRETEKGLLLEKIAQIRKEGRVADRIHLKTSIRIRDEFFTPGMKVKAHLPIPAEREQISDVEILEHTDAKVMIDEPDSLYRSICFEDTLSENRTFSVEYAYTVTANYVDLWSETSEQHGETSEHDEKNAEQQEMQVHLCEQYPHIRFSPYLRVLAAEIVGDEKDPLEIARRIYDYITKNVKYSYMKAYALIPDIPQYCARNLRGDCGVQALLFITLCRICGVPAKWQSGLIANPAYVGPHDWAMFYAAPYGWLYADPSFGGSAYASGDEQRRRFYFGNLDTYRMVANNAFQQNFAVKKTFMPIDPYDNQSGEIESETKGFAGDEIETKKEILECISLSSQQ